MAEVVVLGAGPAGLAAALELAEAGVKVTLLEQQKFVGGNASSFEMGGVNVDYGSHRLHPASDPEILNRIKQVLGNDFLTRPRHGRIQLMGRWIHFPLRPADLALRAHPKFSFGVAIDLVKKLFKSPGEADENFATVLYQGLGKTICKEFYFPYAKKIWGVDPVELSPIQAKKRVSAGSIGKMLKRLLPGGTGSGGANTKGIFYYPRYGFGQICNGLLKACIDAGVDVRLGVEVTKLRLGSSQRVVEILKDGNKEEITADQIYSTIPVTKAVQLIDTETPDSVLEAADSLEFRAMTLVYLQLDQDQFTEYDAHYFPGSDIPFTRMSETKNYSDRSDPKGSTVLCIEMPCFVNDELWTMSGQDLARLIVDTLANVGLPIQSSIQDIQVKRIPYAYPLYRKGYEKNFELLDQWLERQEGLLSFGRQGLYAHDNTHHAMYMAKSAVSCLNKDGSINVVEWKKSRKVFESHVVED